MERAADYIAKALQELGIDLSDENFRDTPRRFIQYLAHYIHDYDPAEDLNKTFEQSVTQVHDHAMVVQVGIPFAGVCAHHLVPCLGIAHVGYIPKERVVGLSKLTRLVTGIARRRPSLQEDVGNEIVDALMEHLSPVGAMAVISAEHGCMAARGVEKQGVNTVTAHIRGAFTEHVIRDEFYKIIAIGNS